MKNALTFLILLFLTCLIVNEQLSAQEVISYEKLRTYEAAEIGELLAGIGVPAGFIVPEYDVDIYKVLYRTPYLHRDSLVQASGAIAIPHAPDCTFPLASYFHGTQSKASNSASHLNGGQYEVGLALASTGYIVSMTDYLGLGFPDEKVLIHPYIHLFSQGHTGVNMIRATKQVVAETEMANLNDQLFLFGYSQGGYATMAVQRIIEEEFPDEFNITYSIPMSGPYDLVEAQVDLIASDEPYPTPGYLPYILLAYQSIYGNLYENISEGLKAPYDSLMPALFYSKEYSIGYINNQSTDVPKHMVIDSLIEAFEGDLNHPLREDLRENHLLDWAPQAPVRILYCRGDDQVTYLNSEYAYDSWTANGAPNVLKDDLGDHDHNGCALFAFLIGKSVLDENREQNCSPVILPVSMLNFVGESVTEGNVLKWVTASERDNDYFTLMRSTDGIKFSAVGQVEGRGTQSIEQAYEFVDKTAPNGVSYYYVDQTDYDGTVNRASSIVTVRRGEKEFNIVHVAPMPARNFVNLKIVHSQANTSDVRLYNVMGQQVFQQNADIQQGINKMTIDVQNLPEGTYFYHIRNDLGELKTGKILIVR